MSSDDHSKSTKKSDCEYNSEHDSDVDMCMADNVDTPYIVDFDSDVDMALNGDDEEEEDTEKDDK